jgi:Uma2 family endonuclease
MLASYLFTRENQFGTQTYVEQRVRVSPTRVRIPDICVMLNDQPQDDVLAAPPFICIEILSPDDSMSRMAERIEDYLCFGVPNVWVIDPRRHKSYSYNKAGMTEAHDNILRSIEPEIVIPVFEFFADLAK